MKYSRQWQDSLELKEEKAEKEDKEETGKKGKQIFVKVESQDASSLLKIGLENTVQELFVLLLYLLISRTEVFLRKNPVSNPSGYGLIKSDGFWILDSSNLFLRKEEEKRRKSLLAWSKQNLGKLWN